MNLGLLRNRNFALLWMAQIVSKLGDVLYNVGVLVTVFERTGSALQTAGVMIASSLPAFLLGPIAGVLVDRYPRKWVMLTMDLVRAALVGLLLYMALQDNLNVWAIYVVVAGLATASTFYEPARLAILPTLVSKERLVQANGLMMTTTQATNAVGFALGGMLVLSIGFESLILINLISFLLASLAILLIRLPAGDQIGTGKQRLPMHRALADGLVYLRSHPLGRPLVTMEVLEHFPHAIWTSALMLVFVQEALGAGPEGWGYQNAIFYAGQLVGAAIATMVAARLARQPGWAIIGNAFLFGVLTLSYALSPSLAFTVALCFFFGPTSAIRDVAQDSLLQASIAPDVLGRVYATRSMLASLAFMLAGILFAWMADAVNVRWIYVLGGVLYLGTAVYALSRASIRSSHITGPSTTLPPTDLTSAQNQRPTLAEQ